MCQTGHLHAHLWKAPPPRQGQSLPAPIPGSGSPLLPRPRSPHPCRIRLAAPAHGILQFPQSLPGSFRWSHGTAHWSLPWNFQPHFPVPAVQCGLPLPLFPSIHHNQSVSAHHYHGYFPLCRCQKDFLSNPSKWRQGLLWYWHRDCHIRPHLSPYSQHP